MSNSALMPPVCCGHTPLKLASNWIKNNHIHNATGQQRKPGGGANDVKFSIDAGKAPVCLASSDNIIARIFFWPFFLRFRTISRDGATKKTENANSK